jgi:hypothetical protein
MRTSFASFMTLSAKPLLIMALLFLPGQAAAGMLLPAETNQDGPPAEIQTEITLLSENFDSIAAPGLPANWI